MASSSALQTGKGARFRSSSTLIRRIRTLTRDRPSAAAIFASVIASQCAQMKASSSTAQRWRESRSGLLTRTCFVLMLGRLARGSRARLRCDIPPVSRAAAPIATAEDRMGDSRGCRHLGASVPTRARSGYASCLGNRVANGKTCDRLWCASARARGVRQTLRMLMASDFAPSMHV